MLSNNQYCVLNLKSFFMLSSSNLCFPVLSKIGTSIVDLVWWTTNISFAILSFWWWSLKQWLEQTIWYFSYNINWCLFTFVEMKVQTWNSERVGCYLYIPGIIEEEWELLCLWKTMPFICDEYCFNVCMLTLLICKLRGQSHLTLNVGTYDLLCLHL